MPQTVSFDAPLPLLPLRAGVVLPGRVTSLPVGRERSIALARSLSAGDHLVLAVQRDPSVEDPALVDLHPIAVLARVKDVTDRGRRGIILLVEALTRVAPTSLVQTKPHWTARIAPVEETGAETDEARELTSSLRELLRSLAPTERAFHDALAATVDAGRVADAITAWLELDDERKIDVLLERDVVARLRLVSQLVQEARAKSELRQRIDSEVRRELGEEQKQAMLRQQLRAIQKELGENDGDELDALRKALAEASLPKEAQTVVDRELGRLESMPKQAAEAQVIRTYLEWIAALPWSKHAEARHDIEAVATALDADHYGLADVKRRILEHMAVLRLSGSARGTILCLFGPPGVGKTSLAQSVADATGRPLVRVSLGGVRDEAEIRGHRRTYVGALPGRLLGSLRKAGVKNPVMVLDEIDKLQPGGFSGNPEAALLEVLDPEQNVRFTDHYLEIPFDLSEVLFIATANDLSTLSPPLRDRLEVIEIGGYTTDEKVRIARDHLVPKQLALHGLVGRDLGLTDERLAWIVRDYTREAGVRQLAREIAKVCRATALEMARGKVPAAATDEDLRRILGRPRFLAESAERTSAPGIAAGLAWTPVGGDVLYIETTRMPGKGRVEITGQLGEVMKESASAALAYLRSHAEELGIDPTFLEKQDLHLHVPAGAVPKDGPSAGVTMFTALASLLTGRRVRHDTAMTGEVTLRGRVLPVGGIKAKVLAAHRAGFTRVLLPDRNEVDLDEVPKSVRDALEIHLVSDLGTVLREALERDVTMGSDGGAPSPRESAGAPIRPMAA